MWAAQGMLGRVTTTTRAGLRAEAEQPPASPGRARPTPSCARTSGPRSRRWSPTTAAPWSSSAPAGASRRSTSWPRRCCGPAGAGPTVIVSPLLALMRNQIAAAERAGIHAVTINSTNSDDWSQTYAAIHRGEVDVLLVSPERLNNPEFRDEVLPRLAARRRAARGRRGALHLRLGARLPPGLPPDPHDAGRPARTASRCWPRPRPPTPASPRTSPSSCRSRAPTPRRRARPARHPRPRVAAPGRGRAAHARRPGWPGWPSTSASCPDRASSTASRSPRPRRWPSTCAVRGTTSRRTPGRPTRPSGWPPRTTCWRGRLKALVATSALGMGFDKPDLGWVVNLGAPASPIAYYQQVGRAGRGIDRAVAVLLPGPRGPRHLGLLRLAGLPARARGPPGARGPRPRPAAPLSTAALEPHVTLRRNRLETMLKVLDVDGAVRRVRGGWEATGEPWAYDAERYARVRETRRAEQAAMLDYVAAPGLPDGVPAPRPSTTRTPAPAAGATAAAASSCRPHGLGRAGRARPRQRLDRPGVEVEPRQAVADRPVRGRGSTCPARSPPDEQAEPGRAVARLTDLGLGAGAVRPAARRGTGRRAPGAAAARAGADARRLGPPGRPAGRPGRRSAPRPGRGWSRTSRTACPATSTCRCWPGSTCSTRTPRRRTT